MPLNVVLYRGEEVKLSISCPWLFLENWGTVYICETAASIQSTLCQAAVILCSEGDEGKGQSRWWSRRALHLALSVSEEGTGWWRRWWSCKAQEHRLFFFLFGFFFSFFVGLHFHWLKGRARTAWAVFQDGFSDVFETIIVSHFLCLHCLLQLPNAETLCSVWT